MKVVLRIQQSAGGCEYRSLTLGAEYEVLGIESDWLRILNDHRDPCLYDAACFIVTDTTEPDCWICTHDENGGRYAYPPEWNRVGFFEDYHDGLEETRGEFWRVLRFCCPDTYRRAERTA